MIQQIEHYYDICMAQIKHGYDTPNEVSIYIYIYIYQIYLTTINDELNQDLALAVSLVRPCRLYGHDALLLKELELTKEKYGSVRRVYIVCDQDSAINEDLQRWMIEKNPTDEVKVIIGSDHMVMFSKPKELCSCLEEIVEKYS